MTKVRIRPDALSIESILEKVGPVKFERPLSFSPPYEDDEQNKAWFMEKAILLRHVFERFPQHEAALSCLIQYCYLELGYPVLVAATNNELNAKDTKRLLSLQKRNDTSSKKYYSDYERAFKPIQEIQDARAQGILLEHPNLGIADWAYQQTISSNGIQLLKSSPGNLKQISRLTEQLMETVKNYQCYKTKRHNSTEPFEGYYGLGWLQGLDFLIHAVDALAPSSRAAQSSLLKRISELFPNSRRVSNYIDKLNSFEEPFELSFTDLASGKCIDTNDYRGYVLIVDFWATWCQPCLTFVPYLKRLLSRHSNEVQVIGISNDDAGLSSDATPEQRLKLEAEVIKCATKHGMDWPILLDSKVHEKWCISSIPTLFVVDQRGILRSLDARRTIAKTVRNLLREKS